MSIPGVRSVLCRLGISYKRGRPYMRSPDVEYTQKLVSVKQALEQAAQHPETHVAFYQDEFSFRRLKLTPMGRANAKPNLRNNAISSHRNGIIPN